MLFLTRCRMRTAVSGVAAGVLAATALAFASAPAQAAEADATPTVTTSVVGASPKSGLELRVTGTNFTAPPTGVYVGIGDVDVEIDWTDSGSAALLIATNYVSAGAFDDDQSSFSTVLTVPAKQVKKGNNYVIHTARAHGLPDRTQDTVTPVSIPFGKLSPKKVQPKLKMVKKPTSTKKGKVNVAIKAVSGWGAAKGKVVVKLKKGKQAKKANGKLNKKGKVAVKLPKLKKGKWKIVAQYKGDKQYKASKVAKKFKVNK